MPEFLTRLWRFLFPPADVCREEDAAVLWEQLAHYARLRLLSMDMHLGPCGTKLFHLQFHQPMVMDSKDVRGIVPQGGVSCQK